MIYDENEHELNEWIDELQEHNKNLQKQIKEGDKLWLKLKQKLERENKKLKEENEELNKLIKNYAKLYEENEKYKDLIGDFPLEDLKECINTYMTGDNYIDECKLLQNSLDEKDTQYEKLQAENDNLYGKIDDLKKELYVCNYETGEMTDTTILKSYETPQFKIWRKRRLECRVVYENDDDDSDLHLGNYIKMLENKWDMVS